MTFQRIFLVLTLWLGSSWLIVGTLVKPLLPGHGLAVIAGLVAILGLTSVPVRTLLRGFQEAKAPSARQRLLQLRPFWYAILLLPLLALSGIVGAVVGAPFSLADSGGRWGLAIGGSLLVVGVVAGFLGSRRLVTRRLVVETPDLPPAFDGLHIVQLSDLHVGPHTSKRHLRRVVETVQRLAPDLIVHTGDQVDDYASDIEPFNAALGHLTAPLGTFAVAGNHDIYAGWHGVRRGLEAMGMTVLVNGSTVVERQGQRLFLAGTGDPAAGVPRHPEPSNGSEHPGPDIPKTLAAIPAGAFTIALAHNPALWPELAARGVQLTLSGHTHHGQISIPSRRWSLASAFLELSMGAYRQHGSLLYIHPGTNFWGIPLRLGALPEVTSLTLRRGDGSRIVEAGVETCGSMAVRRPRGGADIAAALG